MADKHKENNYIDKLKKIQESMPNIILPSRGLINNNCKVNINGSDYIRSDEVKEEPMLNRKGQTLVEYVLIISLVTVIAIAAVKVFGGYLKDSVTKMSCQMIGKEYVESKTVGEAYCAGDEDKLFN